MRQQTGAPWGIHPIGEAQEVHIIVEEELTMNILKIASMGIIATGLLMGYSDSTRAATKASCRGGEGNLTVGEGALRISSVHVLKEKRQIGKHVFEVKSGASMVIPAVMGVSVSLVERAVGCQLGAAGATDDPLAMAGVKASVRMISGAFVVDVTAPSGKATEVLAMAQRRMNTNQAE